VSVTVTRFEAFTAESVQVAVFWVVTPCSAVIGIWGSMDLWNIGILPQYYTA